MVFFVPTSEYSSSQLARAKVAACSVMSLARAMEQTNQGKSCTSGTELQACVCLLVWTNHYLKCLVNLGLQKLCKISHVFSYIMISCCSGTNVHTRPFVGVLYQV